MPRGPALAAICLALIALNVAIDWRDWSQPQDFQGFYTGFSLCGRADRYEPAAHLRFHVERLGLPPRLQLVSPRMPWYDALFRWLTSLDFHAALLIWRLLNLAAFAGFAWLFPFGDWRLRLLAVCASYPALNSLAMGQDVGLALVPLAGALRLWRSGHLRWSGAVLALCGAKWHLFLLIPLAIVAARHWRLLTGLCLGAAGLLVVSDLVQPGWMPSYIALVTLPWREPGQQWVQFPQIMVSLPGLTTGLPFRAPLLVLVIGVLLAAVWLIARRHGFVLGLAAALIVGVVTSNHVYWHDATFLLPPLIMILAATGWQRLIWPQLVPWYAVLPLLLTGFGMTYGFPAVMASAAQVRQVVLVGLALVTVGRLVRRGINSAASNRGPVG